MRYLALATAINSLGKKDGDYFCQEMIRAVKYWEREYEIPTPYFDKIKPKAPNKRRGVVRRSLAGAARADGPDAQIDALAIFAHGSWKALFGAGYNIWNVYDFASAISQVADDITIILYACSCGAGRRKFKKPDLVLPSTKVAEVPGHAGFAMRLAGALQEHGVAFEILAHLNKGKAAKNPFAVRVTADESGDLRREQIIPFVSWWRRWKDPRGRKRWLAWKKKLSTDPVFRFDFPFLSQGTIEDRVDELLEQDDKTE